MKWHLKTDFRGLPPRPFRRKKDGCYYIRLRVAGRRVWRSLNTTKLKEAEEAAYARWYSHQDPEVQKKLVLPSIKLEVALELYQKSERYALLEESTKDTILKRWETFSKWCKERKIEGLANITEDVAAEFLSERGTKNKTFNNYRTDLAQVFGASSEKYQLDNPFRAVQQRTIKRGEFASEQYRAFTDKELLDIFQALETAKLPEAKEWLLACKVAYYTGLRYKDVSHLTWSAIKGFDYIETVPFKTAKKVHKAVLIRINSEFRELLLSIKRSRRVLEMSGYILPTLQKKYKPANATAPFTALLRRLKILNTDDGIAGFHSFRSTVTTKAAKAGVDLEKFGGVVGHTTEAQTEHYNKAALEIDLDFLSLKKLAANGQQ